MSDLNYFDTFNDKYGSMVDFMNRRHINATSPKVKIYPLFRINGPSDTIYNEEPNRIYLPYFSIRGHYISKTWTQALNKSSIIEEDSETTTIILNLDDMIYSCLQLKTLHKSDIFIKYTGSDILSMWKMNEYFYIKRNYNTTKINLTNYSAKTFSDYLNSQSGISVTKFTDGYENALNLINFNETNVLVNQTLDIYSLDKTYLSIDNKVNIGDLIITHHNVLYEVGEAMVGNLKFFNWPQYILKCYKKNLGDNTKLPSNGLNEIFENGYLNRKLQNENFIR